MHSKTKDTYSYNLKSGKYGGCDLVLYLLETLRFSRDSHKPTTFSGRASASLGC